MNKKQLFCVVAMITPTASYAAELIPDAEASFKLTTGYIEQEVNHRAGSTGIESDSFYAQGLFAYQHWIDPQWSVFTQARAIVSTDNSAIIDPETDVSADANANDNIVGELRQAYVEYTGLTSYPNERLRIGLQRIRETSGLWWDEDIEAVSWSAETTELDWLVAVARQFNLYRNDVDLRTQDEDITRLMASIDFKSPDDVKIGFKLVSLTQSTARDNLSGAPFYGADRVWAVTEYEKRWTAEPAFKQALAYRAMASLMFANDLNTQAVNAV